MIIEKPNKGDKIVSHIQTKGASSKVENINELRKINSIENTLNKMREISNNSKRMITGMINSFDNDYKSQDDLMSKRKRIISPI